MPNNKKSALLDVAEQLYMLEHLTFVEIAKRLKLGEKTVRNWASEGGWERKRTELIKTRASTHQELYELVRKMTQAVTAAIDAGKEPPQSMLYALTNLTGKLEAMKSYEDATLKENEATKSKQAGLTRDTINLIEEQVLGIKRKEN